MKCGKCGYDLQTIRWRNVDIDKCFRCGVILLDDGELEKLAGPRRTRQFVSSFMAPVQEGLTIATGPSARPASLLRRRRPRGALLASMRLALAEEQRPPR